MKNYVWNRNTQKNLVPYEFPETEENAYQPFSRRQRNHFHDGTGKFNEQNLNYNDEDKDPNEDGIVENAFENISFPVQFPCVNNVGHLHKNKRIEDHSIVHGWFSLALLSIAPSSQTSGSMVTSFMLFTYRNRNIACNFATNRAMRIYLF